MFQHLHIRPLLNRNIVPWSLADIDLSRSPNLAVSMIQQLFPMRLLSLAKPLKQLDTKTYQPPRHSGYRKEDGEEIERESEGLIDQPAPEVDIGV